MVLLAWSLTLIYSFTDLFIHLFTKKLTSPVIFRQWTQWTQWLAVLFSNLKILFKHFSVLNHYYLLFKSIIFVLNQFSNAPVYGNKAVWRHGIHGLPVVLWHENRHAQNMATCFFHRFFSSRIYSLTGQWKARCTSALFYFTKQTILA